MNDRSFRIRIPDLTKLDQLELQKQLEAGDLVIEEPREDGQTHGELATATAIVIVSLAALRVLAIWLSKSNRRSSVRKIVEVVAPDGTKRTVTIEYDAQSSDSDAKVLEQLAKACDLDVSALGKL